MTPAVRRWVTAPSVINEPPAPAGSRDSRWILFFFFISHDQLTIADFSNPYSQSKQSHLELSHFSRKTAGNFPCLGKVKKLYSWSSARAIKANHPSHPALNIHSRARIFNDCGGKWRCENCDGPPGDFASAEVGWTIRGNHVPLGAVCWPSRIFLSWG